VTVGDLVRSVGMMLRRAVPIVACALAVVGPGAATAGAGRPPAAASAPQTALAVTQTGSVAGPVRYTLRCGPTGGTLPRAARACRALRTDPALLTPVPAGLAFPCPVGQSSFAIAGRYAGRRVNVGFAACTQGQGPVAAHWQKLAPSDTARLTVKPDRAIGLWSLGERESRIRSALGAGHPAGPPCPNCVRTYTTGAEVSEVGNHLFRVATTVTYRGGRAIRIETDNPATVIAGARLDAGHTELERRLSTWHQLACPGGITQLEHGAGPSSFVRFEPFVTRLVVQRDAPSCG
jgi:hypothetical protein